MILFETLWNLKLCMGDIASYLFNQCLNLAFSNVLKENVSLSISDLTTITVGNIVLDLQEKISSSMYLPFAITSCKIEEVTIKLNKGLSPRITCDRISLDVEVKELSFPKMDKGIQVPTAQYQKLDGLVDLEFYLKDIFDSMTLFVRNVKINFKGSLGLSTSEHTMQLFIKSAIFKDMSVLNVDNMTFYICPMMETAVVEQLSVAMTTVDNTTHMVLTTQDWIRMNICGDSYFILMYFVQMIFENQQRIKSALSETVEKDKKSVGITKAENVAFMLEFHKGSDVDKTRSQEDRFSVQVSNFGIDLDFVSNIVNVHAGQVQTTMGYLEEKISLKMQNAFDNHWDVELSIPEVYLRTSQQIVDSLILMFSFRAVWDEYELLFDNLDCIQFRYFVMKPIHIVVMFFSSPVDYKKILLGNWRQLLKLVPPCDMEITLPQTVLLYKLGWEEVIEGYMKELIKTQKMRCARKLMVGVTKRNIKRIFSKS